MVAVHWYAANTPRSKVPLGSDALHHAKYNENMFEMFEISSQKSTVRN